MNKSVLCKCRSLKMNEQKFIMTKVAMIILTEVLFFAGKKFSNRKVTGDEQRYGHFCVYCKIQNVTLMLSSFWQRLPVQCSINTTPVRSVKKRHFLSSPVELRPICLLTKKGNDIKHCCYKLSSFSVTKFYADCILNWLIVAWI